MYEILRSSEFFDRYMQELIPGEFKFITKAYRVSDNSVAVFPKENEFDCYFQLPNFKTTKVPNKRRHIFLLKKNTINSIRIEEGVEEMSDGKVKIPVHLLEVWKDPYEGIKEESEDKSEELNITPQQELNSEEVKENKLDKLIRVKRSIDDEISNVQRDTIELEERLEELKNKKSTIEQALTAIDKVLEEIE